MLESVKYASATLAMDAMAIAVPIASLAKRRLVKNIIDSSGESIGVARCAHVKRRVCAQLEEASG
jgi:hypothetical protein